MARKIDWDKMYRHLEGILVDVEEEVRAEQIHVDLTLGRKPPRIYATFDIPVELSELAEDFSPSACERHRELWENLEQTAHAVARIMKKHDLRTFCSNNPHFKGEDVFTTIYGYEHSKYRIQK